MNRVLVAVDATEDSVHAAEVAHRLFGDDAEYLAVSVADVRTDVTVMPFWGAGWGAAYPVTYGTVWPYRSGTMAAPGERVVAQSSVDEAADAAREQADRSGLPDAEAVGELGDPADAILRAAEERAVDVIVLGSSNRGWFDRLLRPSVSKEIVKHTEVPVLIVR